MFTFHALQFLVQTLNGVVTQVIELDKESKLWFLVVVIFFWSSGILECTCMFFTFENGVSLMR